HKPLPCIYLVDTNTDWETSSFSVQERAYIQQQIEQKLKLVHFNEFGHHRFVVIIETKTDVCDAQEQWRKQGAKLNKSINELKLSGANLS
ncbi:MAG: hypothetical protein ACPGVB_13010, partial [Chitinophagales bacterium]